MISFRPNSRGTLDFYINDDKIGSFTPNGKLVCQYPLPLKDDHETQMVTRSIEDALLLLNRAVLALTND